MLWYLIEVMQHTGDVWRSSDVHKPIGPKTFVIIGAQTIPNLFNNNITMKQFSNVQTGAMHCKIGKNHTIFCRHTDHIQL